MARNLRVLVFGGRTFGDPDYGRNPDWAAQREQVFQYLDHLHARRVIALVIEGGARGADRCAREWAIAHGVAYTTYDAAWDDLTAPGAVVRMRNGRKYNAAAGAARNQRMLDEGKPTAGVAFPGGTGTADMRSRLEAAGVGVWAPLAEVGVS